MNLRKLILALAVFNALGRPGTAAGETVHGETARTQDAARPFLHPLFTDSMVLQRDLADPIWGWAAPGQVIKVTLNGKSATATADAGGKWSTKIGPFKAGGPYALTVAGPQTITLRDVLIGDVWLCSGQSNMEFPVNSVNNAAAEIAAADFPNIRLFSVRKTAALNPRETVFGKWEPCTPASIGNGGSIGFSAVAYFFGRELNQYTGIPIGLIHASVGATMAEAWTSGAALKTIPELKGNVAPVEQAALTENEVSAAHDKAVAAWWAQNDPGSATAPGWEALVAPTDDWKTVVLPNSTGIYHDIPGFLSSDGIIWFRKDIDLPASWAGLKAVLHLGPINDSDTTWINGVKAEELESWRFQRDYRVPAGLLKAGRNTIAIRVQHRGGGGGLYGAPAQMKLEGNGVPTFALAGDWEYRVGAAKATMTAFPADSGQNRTQMSTVLFNGMIAPLVPFGIKGALWYQGESNVDRAKQYQTLLSTMIKDWRSRFGIGDFPFYIVQLANHMPVAPQPGDSNWARLREAQLFTSQTLPNIGLAIAIDIGDAVEIHPRNKQEVGRRLSLIALAKDYGQKIEYSGPIYRGMQIKGNEVTLSFDHAADLTAKESAKLQGFAIAGEDKKWVWADARIEGETVVLSAPDVAKPVAVRYAWANNPVANLFNHAGLPAPPFRTDVD